MTNTIEQECTNTGVSTCVCRLATDYRCTAGCRTSLRPVVDKVVVKSGCRKARCHDLATHHVQNTADSISCTSKEHHAQIVSATINYELTSAIEKTDSLVRHILSKPDDAAFIHDPDVVSQVFQTGGGQDHWLSRSRPAGASCKHKTMVSDWKTLVNFGKIRQQE